MQRHRVAERARTNSIPAAPRSESQRHCIERPQRPPPPRGGDASQRRSGGEGGSVGCLRVWHPNPLGGIQSRRFTQAPPPGGTCWVALSQRCSREATAPTRHHERQPPHGAQPKRKKGPRRPAVGTQAEGAAVGRVGPAGLCPVGGRGVNPPPEKNGGGAGNRTRVRKRST